MSLVLGGSLFGRSLDDIFPGLPADVKAAALGEDAYYHHLKPDAKGVYAWGLQPAAKSGIDISSSFNGNGSSHGIEALKILKNPAEGKITLLDIYNAFQKVSDLAGREYFSFTRNKRVPLWKTATRVDSISSKEAVPDRSPAHSIPREELTCVLLNDINFGNTYYTANLTSRRESITYRLTNAKTIMFIIFPVAKEGGMDICMYAEPITEGVLIYAVFTVRMNDMAQSMVDIPSAAQKRFDVIKDWATDNIYAAAEDRLSKIAFQRFNFTRPQHAAR